MITLGRLASNLKEEFGLAFVPSFYLGRKVLFGWCV